MRPSADYGAAVASLSGLSPPFSFLSARVRVARRVAPAGLTRARRERREEACLFSPSLSF